MTPSYYELIDCVPTTCCECKGKTTAPIHHACPAGWVERFVLFPCGLLSFSEVMLESSAAGSGGFSESLNYLPSPLSDGSVGKNLNFNHNVLIKDLPDGSAQLLNGNGSVETFAPDGSGGYSAAGNNTSAKLRRSGRGTPADTYTLTARDGTVSTFFGNHSSISTPGRLQAFADRFSNTQTLNWQSMAGLPRLASVTDSYSRTVNYNYDPTQEYRLKSIVDFDGRRVDLQYDSQGHLVAIVGPAITRGASEAGSENTFPNGTAKVFQYDVANDRPERRDDLIAVFDPNEAAPYLAADRTVDVAAVYAHAQPRRTISYYNDPTDSFHYGKVQQVIESASASAAVGSGASGFVYLNTGLPANLIDPSDPITMQVIVTDRMGNQATYGLNASGMVVRKEAFATRGKNSLQAASWVTWTKYNSHNQPLLTVMPEGNSVAYEYEDETNTISFDGIAYGRRIGLLKSVTRLPGNSIGIPSRPGSGPTGAVQEQLIQRYFHDPIFGQVCASIEERGNRINSSGLYFPPQNLGTTPTDADRSRYATITFFDYQKDSAATVQADAALQAQLGLTSTEISELIAFVNDQMTATDGTGGTGGIPAGFQMGLGDINGEGTGAGAGTNATHLGNVVKVQHPSVRQLIPNTGGGDPWAWADQARVELFTSNLLGQQTTRTDPEGNLTVYVRYPQNDPDGSHTFLVPTLSNKQYGFVKEVHVDADPATVMSLVGSDGDLVAFTGSIIPRTNTPGVYQDLVTQYRPSTTGSGCASCAYDPMGNPLSVTDPRGFTTTIDRNELGEAFRTTTDAPYNQRVETFYDANRNVTRVDTEDRQVQYDSDDITDPAYAKFTPTGSGSTANLPTKAGPGGSLRPGWFSNLFMYDLLDNKVEQDIDATGSTPANLVTAYSFDFNQNLVKVTKPNGNLVEYDYDERNLRIATRAGYDPASGQPGSISVTSYDGNGNPIDTIGPAQRGSTSQSLSVVIDDAFRSGSALTHVGDWVFQNTFDGFDRLTQSMDAVGGVTQSTFEPGGRVIAGQTLGTAGGATPTDRSGSANVPLASGETRFDEAGRAYEQQREVFLNTGISGGSPTHALPSGRTVTQIGGLTANSTAGNRVTTAILLTAGGTSYVLRRNVFDRSGRVAITAADNGTLTTAAFDGANRQTSVTDALGNVVQNQFDGNGNVIRSTRIEKCTISDSIAPESFAAAFAFDLLNRMIVRMDQGADGSLSTSWSMDASSTIFTYAGFDSRGNRTNLIDPRRNTTVWEIDGAGRQLREKRHLRPSGDGTTAVSDTVLTRTAFDANSNAIRLVDDNGGTTTWTFDSQDRQTAMTFHDGSTRSYAYSLAGNVTGYTDENGSLLANSFDVLGRKTSVAITPATGVVGTTAQSFQFDGLSRMTFCRDAVGSTNADAGFSYDSISRVLEEQQNSGDTRYVTRQAWNSYTPASFTYPNGRQVNTLFDGLYRKAAISEASDSSNIAAWQFFGGRTATVTLANGIVTSFMNDAQNRSAIQQGQTTPARGDITTDHLGYDGSGRLIGKRHINGETTLVGFTTQYDQAGNKLFERAPHAESRSSLYATDSMDRLTQYQRGVLVSGGGSVTTPITLPGTDSQRSYALDGMGNWRNTAFTPEGASGELELRSQNKLNQITAFGVASTSTPVLYDGTAGHSNGNFKNDGTRIYNWDALNRLIVVNRVSDGLQIGAYVYDAIGRRIQKTISNGGLAGTIPSGTSRYLLDSQQIVEELASGSTTVQYVWGQYIDELVQLKALASIGPQPLSAGNYYLLSDLLYGSAALTNSSAGIVEAYDTDAYGNTLLFSAAGTSDAWFADNATQAAWSACRYVFTGREYDAESRTYWYRTRHYDPNFGRFGSRDLGDYMFGPALYLYVSGSSTRLLDPSGMSGVNPPTVPPPHWDVNVPKSFDCDALNLDNPQVVANLQKWMQEAALRAYDHNSGSSFWKDLAIQFYKCVSKSKTQIEYCRAPAQITCGSCVDHRYLRSATLTYNFTDNITKGGLPGHGPAGGRVATGCSPCYRTMWRLYSGKGANTRGIYASDSDIEDCISNFKAEHDYHFGFYDCASWSKSAYDNCGLDCGQQDLTGEGWGLISESNQAEASSVNNAWFVSRYYLNP